MNSQLRASTVFIYDKSRLLVAGVTLLLVLISWSGVLDTLSYDYLDDSLLGALSSYGVSRALNGIISVLQSSTLSVGIASVSVGELLDPINDIIERFSGLLTLSIASIIVQKVLLSIVSSVVFKVMLSVSGLSLLISLSLRATPAIHLLSRFFLFLVFFRLALSLMIMLNSAVDHSFLASQIEANYVNVQAETEKLDFLKDEIIKQKQHVKKYENIIAASNKQKHIFNKKLAVLNKEQHTLENLMRSKQVNIDKIHEKLSTFERYNFLRKDEELDSAKMELAKKQQQFDRVKASIKETRSALRELNEKINESENQISGKSTGLIDDIRKMSGFMQNNSINNVKQKLAEVKENLDFIVNNLLDLMTLYIIKTILFPVLFMYLLIKSFKLIWMLDLRDYVQDQSTMSKLD